jgi:hypothetical protein
MDTSYAIYSSQIIMLVRVNFAVLKCLIKIIISNIGDNILIHHYNIAVRVITFLFS